MNFPVTFAAPCGQQFTVTADHVRQDYAYTVRQFKDLTPEQQEQQIADADEETLMCWFDEQWEWVELISYNCKVGPWKHKAGKANFYKQAARSGTRSPCEWATRLRGNQ